MTTEFFQRHRAGVILFLGLTFSSILLALRVEPYVRGFKGALWFLISPDAVYSGEFLNRFDGLRGRLFHLVVAEGENHILRQQIVEMAKRDIERDALEVENTRLRELLDLRQRKFSDAVTAEVVGFDIRDWFHSIIINKGKKDGVVPSAAVVAGGPERMTLVGRVEEVNETTSKVLLVTDLVSAVSVGVVGKPDMGLLEGRNRPWCVMRYLSGDTTVATNDEITTAGLGGVFPPGVPVGRVVDVAISDDGFFKSARVKPFTDFGSVREVLVLRRRDLSAEGKAKP